MDLFSQIGVVSNCLPFDGIAEYHPNIFSSAEADHHLHELLQGIEWKQDEIMLYGKKIITKRAVAWYGNKPYTYTYSKATKTALPWIPVLREIKARSERIAGAGFNSCLLNLYHDGSEGMSWHSDNEKELLENGAIASVSFGAERKFQFRHKTEQLTVPLQLQHGSMLLMKGQTQQYWRHQVPLARSVKLPRINLTFRTIAE